MKFISRIGLFLLLLILSSFEQSIRADGYDREVALTTTTRQQQNVSITTSEGAAMKLLRALFTAEATYQTTVGKGEYGDMKALLDAGLVDKELASGVKGEYQFTVVTKKSTLSSPPSIDLIARPKKYGKETRRSFYMTESGVLLTSEEKDAALTSMRPFAGSGAASAPTTTATRETIEPVSETGEDASASDIAGNETAVITTLRAIHSAQKEYSTKLGAGAYGTLEQLEKGRLIDNARAASLQHGYQFEVVVIESPAKYSISAAPQSYGVSGRRSFYIDQTGVLRGADKEGGSSDVSDPAVEK